MQKSKIITISILGIIIIYTILKITIFIQLGNIYIYIINPLFWMLMSYIIYRFLGKTYENIKLKSNITQYTLTAGLIYIIVSILYGLFFSYGNNPYINTVGGIIRNFWMLGIPVLFREYIRYKLINNVFQKDKKQITIVITIVFILIDYEIWKIFQAKITMYYIYIQLFEYFMPILAKNILYSYLAYNENCSSAIIYEFITMLYVWISPILPNSPWIVNSITETSIPIILLLYIIYENTKISRFRTKELIKNANPKQIVPFILMIILGMWFSIGIFTIKPVSIASGSMEDELFIGDVAVVKKCNVNDVDVGDIIEYQMDGYTVIHRIVEKKHRKNKCYFITKGDNNNSVDHKEVAQEQLIGKVVFKIKYIGYPAVWLRSFEKKEQQLEIDL